MRDGKARRSDNYTAWVTTRVRMVWIVSGSSMPRAAINWTADHAFIAQHFEIVRLSKERSMYGSNRPQLGRLAGDDLQAAKVT